MGPPRSFATATFPSWVGLSFQMVCSYSGCLCSSSAVIWAIATKMLMAMLDTEWTEEPTLVSGPHQERGRCQGMKMRQTWRSPGTQTLGLAARIFPRTCHLRIVTRQETLTGCAKIKDRTQMRSGKDVELGLLDAGRYFLALDGSLGSIALAKG